MLCPLNGLLLTRNPELLGLFFLSCLIGLGSCGIRPSFERWEGNCARCGKKVLEMQDLFCANFAFSRGPFTPCRKAWCGTCYRPRTLVSFFINEPEDEDGFVWVKKGDEKRFRVARSGDNLISHFQCDLCVFRNIHKRDPSKCHADELALCCLRRANLDSLWSRERSTVSNNARLVRRGAEYNIATGQEGMYPTKGPMPLEDVTGNSVAGQVLLASRELGKYHADHSQ
jgi:hypothetical protein